MEIGIAAVPGAEESPGEALVLGKSWRGGDTGLAVLRELPALTSLTIDDAPLTDAALEILARLPKLRELDLHGTSFTAEALYTFRKEHPQVRFFAHGDAMLGVHAEFTGPCVLSGVYDGSGAKEAGLAAGDDVISVDGHAVRDFGDLTIAVFQHRPGEKIQVEYKRGGEKHTADVVLKERRVLEGAAP
jgi:predicted metalloprotease with PDZ domain